MDHAARTTTRRSLHAARTAVLLAALLVIVATPARAGTVSGSYTLHSQGAAFNNVQPQDAAWNIDGTVLAARAETAVLGSGVLVPPSADSDSRYVAGSLRLATQPPWTTGCLEGDSHVITHSITGIAEPRSALEVGLVLDQLHGTGIAHVFLADSANESVVGSKFAPGLVTRTVDDACDTGVGTSSGPIPVLGHAGETLLPEGIDRWTQAIAWRLRRSAAGSWSGGGTLARTTSDTGEQQSVTASFAIAGTAVSLHAECRLPTLRDLAGARSFAQATAIVQRAGFPVRHTGARHTRAARAGRFYVAEEVGNDNPRLCGTRSFHLLRSLGA